MKFLTLHQPWASLVAYGCKEVETRSWATTYRGLLGICAAATFPRRIQTVCWQPAFAMALVGAGYTSPEDLPLGCVVAVARLTDCVFAAGLAPRLSARERCFGDYGPGRWAWQLERVVRLPQPIPCKGRHRLWTDEDLLLRVLGPLDWDVSVEINV